MKPRRPEGFTVLAILAAAFALFAVFGMMFAGRQPLVRAMLLAWSALGLVAAEALWRVRPWAHSASLALAVAMVSPFAAATLAHAITGAWDDAIVLGPATVSGALVLHALVRHVRDQSSGAAGAAVPVAGPRP